MVGRRANNTSSNLPQAVAAEREVLGGLMLDPSTYPVLADRLTAAHFYDARHRAIWSVFSLAWHKHQSFDAPILANLLGANLSAAGGFSYLTAIGDHITTAGPTYYAALVEDAYRRRSIFLALEEAQDHIGSTHCVSDALAVLIDTARRQEEAHKVASSSTMRDGLKDTFKLIEDCQKGRAGQVETGLKGVDEEFVILPPDLVLLAARPGQGKTALAMNISRHILDGGQAVGFISLEMQRTQLLMRWLSMLSGVSVDRMRRRDGIYEREYPILTHAAQQMSTWRLHIEDGTDKTVADIRQLARVWKQQHDIKLLVVDYFQLLHGADTYNSREQEMADCSRSLKALSKELHIPALVLCQMNREMERRKNSRNPNPRPTMADLRETGQLEQDADAIVFLHAEDDQILFLVEKQRQGKSPLEVPLHFAKAHQRFESA